VTEEKLLAVPEDWHKAMAIVAHPDDMEYGGAGAVARWTSQGKEVVYLMVTRGEAGMDAIPPAEAAPIREQEQVLSAKEVGVDIVEFLDFTDGVVEYGLPLRKAIARAIRRHKPDLVVTNNFHLTWEGSNALNMADHRVVGMAVPDAARDAGNRWIFPELLDEGHAPWNGVKSVLIASSSFPTHAVDITDHVDAAVRSLQRHKMYIDNLGRDFDPESFITFSAAASGPRLGCDYATTFQLISI
jgi:LmbE family N-acetylglucosaminyl deacetylase